MPRSEMTVMLCQIKEITLKARIFTGCLPLALLCFAVILLALPGAVPAADGPEETAGKCDAKLLEGSWVRPDGGYVLELHKIEDDGTLSAAYFNPRQIRISQAFWISDAGSVVLFVELRDINYPGSKYSLRYDSVADRLKGRY